ncbi:MAG: outer membrane protein assembly factor BamD [Thermoanaerobaculia bacterium]
MRVLSQLLNSKRRPGTAAAALLALSAALVGASSCSSVDPATRLTRELLSMPKEEAYAKGDSLIARKKYDVGRQYLRFVAENYANDPIGKQAALRLADSYFDQKTLLGYLEAQARYKDFRNRYPSHPRSDYALFRLAQTSDRQAEKPDRDQSNTRLAATSYRELIQAYPDSPYAAEARARLQIVKDLLAEHEYKVGHFYLKRKAYSAAKSRFDVLLSAFPDYHGLDIVLYEAGLTERKLGHDDDARVLWDKLAHDYPASPWLKKLPAGERARATEAVVATPEISPAPTTSPPVVEAAPAPAAEPAPIPVESFSASPSAPPVPAATLASPDPSAPRSAGPDHVHRPVGEIRASERAGRPPVFVVQFASYATQAGADSDAALLAKRLRVPAHVVPADLGAKGVWYRVYLGEFATVEEAEAFRSEAMKSTSPTPGLVYRLVSS